eukprot:g6893.t1 g6893   contig23:1432486-1433213(-)
MTKMKPPPTPMPNPSYVKWAAASLDPTPPETAAQSASTPRGKREEPPLLLLQLPLLLHPPLRLPEPVIAAPQAPAPEATTSPVSEPTNVEDVTNTTEPTAEQPKKKKKKKTSYKNMLADMMKESGARDVEMEKKSIEKVTGGGKFSKIDKI